MTDIAISTFDKLANNAVSFLPSYFSKITTFDGIELTHLRSLSKYLWQKKVEENSITELSVYESDNYVSTAKTHSLNLILDSENIEYGDEIKSRSYQLLTLAQVIQSFTKSPLLDDTIAKETIKKSVKDALTFTQIIPQNINFPSVAPTDDGEIVFLWSNNSRRAEVRFSGDGEVGYTLYIDNQFRPGNIKISPSTFPKELRVYLE